MVLPVGCKKTEQNKVEVKTSQVTDITSTTATASGMLVSSGNSTVYECGVCWCEARNSDGSYDYSDPTVTSYHMSAGAGVLGSFTCKITGLLPKTDYRLRAYALDNDGVTYGYTVWFKTLTDNGNGGGNGTNNGHDYVDLGLPSGTLWATCNVGATTPEGYGNFFAWGEVEPKTVYSWNTYTYCYGGDYYQLTKYCNDSYYGYNGFTDDLTVLLWSDDAAHEKWGWGSGWRMPTRTECQELWNNTTNIWTTRNGVNGRLFTATNGNSIFLPACNRMRAGSGCYWSCSLDADDPSCAYSLGFDSDKVTLIGVERNQGQSVRPVFSAN